MKKILLILLLLPTIGFCQTKITRNQIQESVFRPENGGALVDPWEVNFDVPHKRQTLTVDEDITLGLTGTPEVDSYITIIATGDGTHTLSFPSNWKIKSGSDTYDPTSVNQVKLYYNGIGIIVDITAQQQVITDVLETELLSAIVTTAVPNELNLSFNEAVNATSDGWAVTTDAATSLTIGGVSGSGTTNIIFTLSRAVLYTETVTVGYGSGVVGSTTTDLAGFELTDITDFPVTVPDPPPPVSQNCDITVIQGGGGDFTTITAGNAAASADDVICIGNGTYRETITPLVNGLTFVALDGTNPIISGLELVGTSGWTVHSGNIYKKTITLPVNGHNTSSTVNAYIGNTTILANQIIRNGDMMHEAREPDIASIADLMKWQSYRQLDYNNGFTPTQINDATLPLAPSGLVGGLVVSNGWYTTFVRPILAHDNSGPGGVERITYNSIGGTGNEAWHRQAYYVTGKLGLLDADKEWHYESGTLYFQQPGGGTPTGTIEYKARNWGFDIRGRSNIKIIGIEFIGVDPVVGNASSTNALVQGTTATYNNHHVRHDVSLWSGIYYGMAYNLGTKLLGANSVFKDNDWDVSASTMLWIGPNCRVENNEMTNSLYAGNGGGTIILWENDGGQVITRNTIDNTGRNCIFHGVPFNGSHTNVEISYNKMFRFGTISGDGGGTYTAGQTNTTGLNYHHNWIFEGQSRRAPPVPPAFAIYFDQASGPGTIHHNVVWSTAANPSQFTDIYHEITNQYRTSGTLLNIYNNTFASTNLTEVNVDASYLTWVTSSQDIQRNNIYRRRININSTGSVGNNQNYLLSGTNPLFVGNGETGDGLDFRLQSGSPAINNGQVIGGITDGSVGAPDIGAYEFGGEAWVPGYTVPVNDGTVDDDQWTFSANWAEDNTNVPIVMNELDVHTTFTINSTATRQFTNSKAKFYLEGCDNHGIAKLEILNNSMVVIATHNLDTFVETGSGVCDAGTRIEYEFTGLAAGTKTARVTFQTADLGQTPPRNCITFDGGRFYD